MSFTTPERYKRKVTIDFKNSPSRTEQEHKDSCDIHFIMRKYEETGICNHLAKHQGTYMDMTDAPGFYEAQNVIAEAKSMFETVPASIREEFDNDPGKFLDFMQNQDNYEEIAELGLDNSHLPKPPDADGQLDIEEHTKPTKSKKPSESKSEAPTTSE